MAEGLIEGLIEGLTEGLTEGLIEGFAHAPSGRQSRPIEGAWIKS